MALHDLVPGVFNALEAWGIQPVAGALSFDAATSEYSLVPTTGASGILWRDGALSGSVWGHFNVEVLAGSTTNWRIGFSSSAVDVDQDLVSFGITEDLIPALYVNGVQAVTGTTPLPAVPGAFKSVHLELYLDATNGFAKIYFNDDLSTPALEYLGDMTQGGAFSEVDGWVFVTAAATDSVKLKGFSVFDDKAPVNLVNTLKKPIGDGVHQDWLRSSGSTAYSLIDEQDPDVGDFIEATGVGQRSTFLLDPALPVGDLQEKLTYTALVARTGTAAGTQLAVFVRLAGGQELTGTPQLIEDGVGPQWITFDVPEPSGGWTSALIDTAEFGVITVA